MNDPGTADPITDAAADMEKQASRLDEEESDDGEDMTILKPSRWWLASTGAPLAAGTFGPIASFLSICALVQPWRAHTQDNKPDEQTASIPDPAWLIAVNAVSLVFALIANAALLLNMARRLSLRKAQPIIIIGWFLSGVLLFCLVAATTSRSTGFRKDPPEEHAFTQAYFYAIYAAAIYNIISAMMIATFFAALTGRSSREYTLTSAQRTLMLQTISFLVYMLLGSLVYKEIENWQYLDAVYWADYTLLTIGIGSPFAPATVLGEALLFPYAIIGILTIGIVIGSVRSLALDRGKEKLRARFIEKKREKSIESIDVDKRTISISLFKTYRFPKQGTLSEPQRRENEFLLMRKIEKEAAARQRWMSLSMSFTATIILWLIGALIFYLAEKEGQNWTYFQALYFAYTCLLTIGYGDFKPNSAAGKSFFVLWTLLAVPTLTILISHMGDTIIKSFTDFILWAGTITILPGENKMTENIKLVIKRAFKGVRIRPQEFGGANQPPGMIPYTKGEGGEGKNDLADGDGSTDYQTLLRNAMIDRFAKHITDEQLQHMHTGKDDSMIYDRYNFIYVLLRELIDVMSHLADDRPKQYSYHDWAWYLKLLGQDEDNAEMHSRPRQTIGHEHNYHDRGVAGGSDRNLKWSWVGLRSPLMSEKTEAGWIAEQLGNVLEEELNCLRTGKHSTRPVPICKGDVVQRLKQRRSNSSDDQQDESSEGDEIEQTRSNGKEKAA